MKVGVTPKMDDSCAVKYFEHWEQVRSLAVREKSGRLRIIAAIKKTHPKAMMFDSARFAKWVAKTSDFLPV